MINALPEADARRRAMISLMSDIKNCSLRGSPEAERQHLRSRFEELLAAYDRSCN